MGKGAKMSRRKLLESSASRWPHALRKAALSWRSSPAVRVSSMSLALSRRVAKVLPMASEERQRRPFPPSGNTRILQLSALSLSPWRSTPHSTSGEQSWPSAPRISSAARVAAARAKTDWIRCGDVVCLDNWRRPRIIAEGRHHGGWPLDEVDSGMYSRTPCSLAATQS
eukprot:scaffold2730_cov247-Pinguiococcus_pyrenoidosus.AAC.2